MRVTAYRPTLRLRVEPIEGASLRQTLIDLVEQHQGDPHRATRCEVQGAGRIDAVRLVGASAATAGIVEVIQLTGDADRQEARLRLLGRGEDGALIAGALLDARAVELVLDVELLELVDAAAPEERREQPGAAARASAPGTPPARIPSKSSTPPSWAAVAAATLAREEAEAAAAPPEAPAPEIGDRVEHPTFGPCTVEKIDADEEFIMVRSATQRLLRLSLDVLRLELVGEEGGHKQFRARGVRPTGKAR